METGALHAPDPESPSPNNTPLAFPGYPTADQVSSAFGGSPLSVATPRQSRVPAAYLMEDVEVPEYSNIELVCPINADKIATRWMNPYIPLPEQVIKTYPPRVSDFIYRILKSYSDMVVRGRRTLPFIHWSQLLASTPSVPLTTCLTIVRMCDTPLPGSSGPTIEVMEREMEKMYENRLTYDGYTLLSAFQAYLIYAMVLFFRLRHNQLPHQTMTNLQTLACLSCRDGLACPAEQHNTRPRWENWIAAEAKRRALYTMYLFDNVLSNHDGLPTFLGTELEGLLAPGSRSLWDAKSRQDWTIQYNTILAEWPDGGLHIEELWAMPSHYDDSQIERRRSRVDHWLEDLDGFGTMIYAVTSCTHGG